MPEPDRSERKPLPPVLYNLVQRVATYGIKDRYIPLREEALAWNGIPDGDILEVGCGTGLFASRGVAIDLDLARVRSVHETGRLAAAADATRLPFAGGAFSVVYCEGVLHHIDDAGAAAALAEMLRVCRPAGRVFLMDSVWPRSPLRVLPWILRRADFGRHVRTEEQLRGLLQAAGGRVLQARRLTYSAIGLEALVAVLVPNRASR